MTITIERGEIANGWTRGVVNRLTVFSVRIDGMRRKLPGGDRHMGLYFSTRAKAEAAVETAKAEGLI